MYFLTKFSNFGDFYHLNDFKIVIFCLISGEEKRENMYLWLICQNKIQCGKSNTYALLSTCRILCACHFSLLFRTWSNILIIRKSSSNSVSCMSGILRIIIFLHFYALMDDVSFVINWAKSSQIHNFVAIKGQLSKNGSSQTKEK